MKSTRDKCICIATGIYPPDIGGPATHTVFLEKELPHHGIMVSVVPFGNVKHLPKGVRHLVFFFHIFFVGFKSDLIFAQDTVSVGAPARLAALVLRKPFIVRVPGDYAWEQARQRFGINESIDEFQDKRYGFRVRLLRFIQRLVVRSATAVVTPSDYFNKLVSNWGVRPEIIRTIYNGIDTNVEVHTVPDIPQRPFMISAGRIVPWKGFEMLVELLVEMPQWTLVIVGDGPYREKLQKKVNDMGVSNRVKITGALSRPELFYLLQQADVFVLNTSFESFSYQIVEAMACGVPIITTYVGSIPELIQSSKEGILLKPDDREAFLDTIQSVVEDTSCWNIRKKNAKERSNFFSIEKTVSDFANLFQTYI